jgi:hypothetical protein
LPFVTTAEPARAGLAITPVPAIAQATHKTLLVITPPYSRSNVDLAILLRRFAVDVNNASADPLEDLVARRDA